MAVLKSWRRLARREVFSAPPRVSVTIDTVELPDGRIVDDYYRVRLEDAVSVFAQTQDGRILTLRQYKYGPERITLSFPGGHREDHETWQNCARRELLEETGYQAETWRDLGAYVHNDNRGCGLQRFFMAF